MITIFPWVDFPSATSNSSQYFCSPEIMNGDEFIPIEIKHEGVSSFTSSPNITYNLYTNGAPALAHGAKIESIMAESTLVSSSDLDETLQVLAEVEEELHDSHQANLDLWQCLENSEADLSEVTDGLNEAMWLISEFTSAVLARDTRWLDEIVKSIIEDEDIYPHLMTESSTEDGPLNVCRDL